MTLVVPFVRRPLLHVLATLHKLLTVVGDIRIRRRRGDMDISTLQLEWDLGSRQRCSIVSEAELCSQEEARAYKCSGLAGPMPADGSDLIDDEAATHEEHAALYRADGESDDDKDEPPAVNDDCKARETMRVKRIAVPIVDAVDVG